MNNIIIVDDHQMMLYGIKSYIEENTNWKVLNTFSTSKSVLDFLKTNNADVIIIDINLGKENGFDLAKTILSLYKNIKIILYSMHEESGFLLEAKKIGAHGYISKASSVSEFIDCIQKVLAGNNYYDERLNPSQNKLSEIIPFLTNKELLILQEILKDKSNQQIAQELEMTKHSVETYCSLIYDKTQTTNRKELLEKYL